MKKEETTVRKRNGVP